MTKPHRLYRSSKRVSSETGTSIDCMITDKPEPTPYQRKREQILSILRTMPINERKTMFLNVFNEIMKEDKFNG